MKLALDISLAKAYKSGSQIARVLTEGWFSKCMYCPQCDSDNLSQSTTNTPVVDFFCPGCKAEFQLKAKARPLGTRLRDAAYEPMQQRIREGTSPHFAFLHYDAATWSVRTLLLVPGHFLTLSAIERCRPLGKAARRAGWVGCNILASMLPPEARIEAVSDGECASRENVRQQWRRFTWLGAQDSGARAWTTDVMRIVQQIGKRDFTLADVYAFEQDLARLHPDNRHVRDKVRQQLQILRDRGVLTFKGRGQYRLTAANSAV